MTVSASIFPLVKSNKPISGFYPDQQRWPPDTPAGIPPGAGGHSSHSNNPWTDERTGPTGGSSKNNMDSQFFPPGSASKASEAQKGSEGSTAPFFGSNTEDEYKRPEDPSRPFTHSVSVGPGGVGSLANINRDLFGSESGVKRGNKGVKGSAGTSSRSPSSTTEICSAREASEKLGSGKRTQVCR